jgi:hypothetical protein
MRHDAAILATRLPVEEEKPAEERGFVEYPEPWEATNDSVVSLQGWKEIISTAGPREQEPAVACS